MSIGIKLLHVQKHKMWICYQQACSKSYPLLEKLNLKSRLSSCLNFWATAQCIVWKQWSKEQWRSLQYIWKQRNSGAFESIRAKSRSLQLSKKAVPMYSKAAKQWNMWKQWRSSGGAFECSGAGSRSLQCIWKQQSSGTSESSCNWVKNLSNVFKNSISYNDDQQQQQQDQKSQVSKSPWSSVSSSSHKNGFLQTKVHCASVLWVFSMFCIVMVMVII